MNYRDHRSLTERSSVAITLTDTNELSVQKVRNTRIENIKSWNDVLTALPSGQYAIIQIAD